MCLASRETFLYDKTCVLMRLLLRLQLSSTSVYIASIGQGYYGWTRKDLELEPFQNTSTHSTIPRFCFDNEASSFHHNVWPLHAWYLPISLLSTKPILNLEPLLLLHFFDLVLCGIISGADLVEGILGAPLKLLPNLLLLLVFP